MWLLGIRHQWWSHRYVLWMCPASRQWHVASLLLTLTCLRMLVHSLRHCCARCQHVMAHIRLHRPSNSSYWPRRLAARHRLPDRCHVRSLRQLDTVPTLLPTTWCSTSGRIVSWVTLATPRTFTVKSVVTIMLIDLNFWWHALTVMLPACLQASANCAQPRLDSRSLPSTRRTANGTGLVSQVWLYVCYILSF